MWDVVIDVFVVCLMWLCVCGCRCGGVKKGTQNKNLVVNVKEILSML